MNNTLNYVIMFFASFWIWIMYFALILIWFFNSKTKRRWVVHAFIVSFVSWGIARMIKDLFPFALRPFQLNGFPPLTLTIPSAGAFPSGHSAAAFGLAVAIFLFNKKIGLVFLLGAFIVSCGRILGNVHYPIDVIGGAILGAFIALISEKIRFFKLHK